MTDLFLKIVNLGISASWIIIAVLIVRAIFAKRMPKWISCCLWGLVALRLVIPFTLESDISLVPNRQIVLSESADVITAGNNDTEKREDFSATAPTDSENKTDIDVSNSIIDGIQQGAVDTSVNVDSDIFINGGADDKVDTSVGIGVYDEAEKENNGEIIAEVKPKGLSQSTVSVLSVIWLCGFAVMSIYAVISYATLKKRIALSVPFENGLRKGEGVESPFVFGFFRPRIYLPFGLGQETEKYVIAHERAHIKRKDNFVKPLGFLILSVYWFNPLVWAAYILLCRDIEYACDEKVINTLAPEARKEYALALLECATCHRRISACPIAFGETGVKERVKNTMNYKKPAFWIIIIGVIACITVAVLFLTTSSDGDESSLQASSETESVEISEEQSENSEVSEDTEESKPNAYTVEFENDLFCAGTAEDYSGTPDYMADAEYNVALLYITPYENITDLYVYEIDSMGFGSAVVKEQLYHKADIKAGETLTLGIEFDDILPVNAIAFKCKDGNVRYFGFAISNYDGELIFDEFVPYSNENETSEETQEPNDTPAVSSNPIKVEEATDAKLASLGVYDSYGNGDRANIIRVIITPNERITDFAIYRVEPVLITADLNEYIITDTLYRQTEMTKEKPLVADIEVGDILPENAVSFVDANGEMHCYTIIDSPVDAGVIIVSRIPKPNSNASEPESGGAQTHSHSYSVTTVAATCKSEGYTLHKCECGDEYIDQITEKSVEHDFPRTGTVYGYDCKVCGLRVCARGNYDGSPLGVSRPIKYYVTGGLNTGEDRTLVIYGNGEIPDASEWDSYWNMGTGCYAHEITKIVICEGVTSIGSNAFNPSDEFSEFSRVRNIEIASSVTHIGDYAFAGVTNFNGTFYMRGVRTTGDEFLPPKCNSVYISKNFEYTTHNFALNEYIYYQGTEEEFGTIGFYDDYNGHKPLIELYEAYANQYKIYYNC